MKKFLIYFPFTLKLIHVEKDVGVIPRLLSLNHDVTTSLIVPEAESKAIIRMQEFGVEVVSLKKLNGFQGTPISKYLKENAQKYDYVQSYFFTWNSLWLSWIYKFYNKQGKFIIKSDYNPNVFSHLEKAPIIFSLMSWIYSKIDLLIVEIYDSNETLKHKLPFLKRKLVYIPNGFLSTLDPLSLRDYCFKQEKVIIVCGRIGLEFKGHELIIHAIKDLEMKGWVIKFIGEVSRSFELFVQKELKTNPDLMDKIEFLGFTTDRSRLEKIYASAYAICHPSIVTQEARESTVLALVESLGFGLKLLVSDAVPSALELTGYGKYGTIFKSNCVDSLRNTLYDAMVSFNYNHRSMVEERIAFSKKYDWNKIVANYFQILQNN